MICIVLDLFKLYFIFTTFVKNTIIHQMHDKNMKKKKFKIYKSYQVKQRQKSRFVKTIIISKHFELLNIDFQYDQHLQCNKIKQSRKKCILALTAHHYAMCSDYRCDRETCSQHFAMSTNSRRCGQRTRADKSIEQKRRQKAICLQSVHGRKEDQPANFI